MNFKKTISYFAIVLFAFSSLINYRVDNLEALLLELKRNKVKIIGEMQEFDYGKFAWVIDPDGRKVELWEPTDESIL